MSEILFVVKCFIFTAILVVLMQLKISGTSIETYSYNWLKKSTTSQYIQSVAAGGVVAIKNLSFSLKNGIAGVSESFHSGAEEQAHR